MREIIASGQGRSTEWMCIACDQRAMKTHIYSMNSTCTHIQDDKMLCGSSNNDALCLDKTIDGKRHEKQLRIGNCRRVGAWKTSQSWGYTPRKHVLFLWVRSRTFGAPVQKKSRKMIVGLQPKIFTQPSIVSALLGCSRNAGLCIRCFAFWGQWQRWQSCFRPMLLDVNQQCKGKLCKKERLTCAFPKFRCLEFSNYSLDCLWTLIFRMQYCSSYIFFVLTKNPHGFSIFFPKLDLWTVSMLHWHQLQSLQCQRV